MNDLVELGYIAKAFGLKGAVVVSLFNEGSNALQIGATLIVKQGKNAPKPLTISQVLSGNRVFFEGIDDRTKAELLRGASLSILRSNLPAPEPDEYYLQDLLGAQVFDTKKNLLGQLVNISSNTAQDLAEVKTVAGHKAYVPLVPPIVVEIDLERKIIVIDPPTGLLDPMV